MSPPSSGRLSPPRRADSRDDEEKVLPAGPADHGELVRRAHDAVEEPVLCPSTASRAPPVAGSPVEPDLGEPRGVEGCQDRRTMTFGAGKATRDGGAPRPLRRTPSSSRPRPRHGNSRSRRRCGPRRRPRGPRYSGCRGASGRGKRRPRRERSRTREGPSATNASSPSFRRPASGATRRTIARSWARSGRSSATASRPRAVSSVRLMRRNVRAGAASSGSRRDRRRVRRRDPSTTRTAPPRGGPRGKDRGSSRFRSGRRSRRR